MGNLLQSRAAPTAYLSSIPSVSAGLPLGDVLFTLLLNMNYGWTLGIHHDCYELAAGGGGEGQAWLLIGF